MPQCPDETQQVLTTWMLSPQCCSWEAFFLFELWPAKHSLFFCYLCLYRVPVTAGM